MSANVHQLELTPRPRTLERATVIPWEPGEYGVEIKWSDGCYECYRVGDQRAAKAETERLRGQRIPSSKNLSTESLPPGR